MNTNIELSGLKTHFFSKKPNVNSKDFERTPKKTKLVKYGFYSVNEVQISNKIKDLPDYGKKYNILDDFEFININQYIEKIELNSNDKYMVFHYKNGLFIDFETYLYQIKTPKILFFWVIESLSYLLNNLYTLNENNVCFFNLCPQNIVFLNHCGEKPIICNFQHSIQLIRFNENYFAKIINDLDVNYIYKPLEVHVLFYLIKNDLNTISYSFIEEICEIYTNNLTVLEFFSPKYIESYKKSCIETLKPFVNKKKGEIIKELMQNVNTWDIFSLSMLYLHIIGNIIKTFSLENTFINKLFLELLKNIHPNSDNRYCLEDMREIFDKLFNEEKCWKYINSLNNEKMNELILNLQK